MFMTALLRERDTHHPTLEINLGFRLETTSGFEMISEMNGYQDEQLNLIEVDMYERKHSL
jgi:hypothetical protein